MLMLIGISIISKKNQFELPLPYGKFLKCRFIRLSISKQFSKQLQSKVLLSNVIAILKKYSAWRFRFEIHHWLSKRVCEVHPHSFEGNVFDFDRRGLFRDSVRHFLNINHYHFLSFNSHFFRMCEYRLFSESALLKITKYQFVVFEISANQKWHKFNTYLLFRIPFHLIESSTT